MGAGENGMTLWEILFGRYEPTWTWEEIAEAIRKHRYECAISAIKNQPFFMPKNR